MKTNKTWQIPVHWNSRCKKILQNILLLSLKLWHGKIAIVLSMQSQELYSISSNPVLSRHTNHCTWKGVLKKTKQTTLEYAITNTQKELTVSW